MKLTLLMKSAMANFTYHPFGAWKRGKQKIQTIRSGAAMEILGVSNLVFISLRYGVLLAK